MKGEDQTDIWYIQPMKIEKPLQCSHRRFLASFVKEIKLPFSKLKQQQQQKICNLFISSASSQMHSVEPIVSDC